MLIGIESGQNSNIAEIVLNRPEARNAFNSEMAEQILEICQTIDRSDVRVVLITSSNEKSFCSGADLKERNNMTEEEWRNQHELFQKMFNSIQDIEAAGHCCSRWLCISWWF